MKKTSYCLDKGSAYDNPTRLKEITFVDSDGNRFVYDSGLFKTEEEADQVAQEYFKKYPDRFEYYEIDICYY